MKDFLEKQIKINIFDPVIKKKQIPKQIRNKIAWFDDPFASILNSNCLVVGLNWPSMKNDFKKIQENFSNKYLVVDPNHYLSSLHLENNFSYNYKAVGLNI